MDNKNTKLSRKKKDNLTITADVSSVLKSLNRNTGWKNISTKFGKNIALSNNTINPQQLTKNLMNQQDLQKLFHKSKQKLKIKTQTNCAYVPAEWGNRMKKDFANSVKFLKLDDESDKLLTGIPVNTEYDEDLINFLFQDEDKQDLTSNFKKQYLVGKVIGQGAYASVRVAIYKSLNKKVAIKIYEKTKIKQPQRKKSLRRQIKILQMLSHQNIVQIWDVVQTNNHVNIVMQYLTGISLSSYLKMQPGQKASEKNAKKVIKALADALKYLHQRKISHRDIKLQNIIINQELSPKLIDFGFSTCIERTKKIKIFCGTPSYMAPQIVQKQQYRGENADIWALGVLSYVLITGFFPFKGNSDEQLYKKINKADYSKTELQFSKQFSDLMGKMLTVNPEQRITAAQILNHSWFFQNSNSLVKKTKRVQTSYEYRKKTTTSSHKSSQKPTVYIQNLKKLNETCKQNLKIELKASKQSPGKLNKTCTNRKIAKQLCKNNENEKLVMGFNLTSSKQILTKTLKANRILDIVQQSKKRAAEQKIKNKIRRL